MSNLRESCVLETRNGHKVSYLVLVWPPVQCPGCGTARSLVVNRDGKTLCAAMCDPERSECQ
jgi:hypothetical protein